MHNTARSGHESNCQLFFRMGGDILLLHAALTLNQQTSQLRTLRKRFHITPRVVHRDTYAAKKTSVSGSAGTFSTLHYYDPPKSVKQNVLVSIIVDKGCFSGKLKLS